MTREEAIKIVRNIYQTDKEKEALATLIPELHESEDERIRKEIIDFVNHYRHNTDITTEQAEWCKKVIAYLEKQKEQKHPNGCFTCDEYKKGYEEGRRNGFTAGYNKAMKEVEQKEQKPVERWQYVGEVDLKENREEEKPSIELIQRSWYMEGYHDRKFNKEPKWIIKTGEGGPRYEENPKYGQIIEQKSTEWSDEDEKILDGIINTLDRLGYAEFCKSSREEDIEEERFYYKEIQCLKKLKSLRPQPK